MVVVVWYRGNFDILILLLLSLETTTKITPWSLDCTSEFRQLFNSGESLPHTDQSLEDGWIASPLTHICYRLALVLKWKSDLVNERKK